MPRTVQQLEDIKQARRAEILDAALRVFSRRGLDATKITDIAEQAGVSHGLLYHYFPTKERVFAAIVKRSAASGVRVIDDAERSEPDPMAALGRIVDEMLQGVREDRESALVLAHALSSEAVSLDIRRSIQESEDAILERLVVLIERCQADGCIPQGDATGRAVALLAVMQGLIAFRAYGGRFAAALPSTETVLGLLRA
jgi:AcrR family transcriptional regulator